MCNNFHFIIRYIIYRNKTVGKWIGCHLNWCTYEWTAEEVCLSSKWFHMLMTSAIYCEFSPEKISVLFYNRSASFHSVFCMLILSLYCCFKCSSVIFVRKQSEYKWRSKRKTNFRLRLNYLPSHIQYNGCANARSASHPEK